MESEKYGANARWMILDGAGKVVEDGNVSAFDETTVRRIRASMEAALPAPDHGALEYGMQEPQPRRQLEIHEIKRDKYDIELPASIIESFARFLVPEIRKYYNSEQGQQEFAEWQEAQKQNADAERP